MKKTIFTFLTLVAVWILLEEPQSQTSKAPEVREPHQLLNHLWLRKDASAQTEKERIERSFDFQTQG